MYIFSCLSCPRTKGTQYRSQREFFLLPAIESLPLIAMDLSGSFPKSNSGHDHYKVIIKRITKFTRAIPPKSTTCQVTTDELLVYNTYSCSLPDSLLYGNGAQFTRMLLPKCTGQPEHQTSIDFNIPPADQSQTGRYNSSTLACQRHYVTKRQKNWDSFVQLLTYEYSTQVHRSTKQTPLELVASRRPTRPPTVPCHAYHRGLAIR